MFELSNKYRIPITILIIVITAAILVVGVLVATISIQKTLYKETLTLKKESYKDSVDNLISYIDIYRSRVEEQHPDWSDKQVKEEVTNQLRAYMYAMKPEDDSYMWIQEIKNYSGGDDYAIRLIHPNLKETEGASLSTNTDDGTGNRPYEMELNGINRNGRVFLTYQFKKLDSDEMAEKVTYSALYRDYNWIVSRGVTLEEVSASTTEIMKSIYPILILLGALFIFGVIISLRNAVAITRKNEQIEFMKEKRQLREKVEESQSASQAKSRFLFNMSHDIRTPMNAIMGYTDMAIKYQEDTDRQNTYLKKIKVAGQQLMELLNGVLEMARIESDKITIREEVMDTRNLFEDAVGILANEAENKGIDFSYENRIREHYLYADKVRLSEIFINLVSNAVKYTQEGGSIRVWSEQLPSDEEGMCVIESVVEDTGIGMSEEFQKHIFEEFTREHTTTSSGIQGTGLGLAIVHRLVLLMDGTIDIESELGKGSRVTMRIPHRIASAPESEAETSEIEDMSFLAAGKRILLAEDNEMNAEIADDILSDVGFTVDHAEDGLECLKMLENNPAGYYDLILMDIQMPNMGGYEATRRIRAMEDADKRNIPVFAMTANAFKEDADKSEAEGMNGHISKPISVPKLLEAIKNVLH